MILTNNSQKLLARCVWQPSPLLLVEIEEAVSAYDSLTMLGLVKRGEPTQRGEEVLRNLVSVSDISRLPGAKTAFGKVAGLALLPEAPVRITFVHGDQILLFELPADCFIEVVP